jgi:hypothetical protein
MSLSLSHTLLFIGQQQIKFLQERFGLKREQIIVRETSAKVLVLVAPVGYI